MGAAALGLRARGVGLREKDIRNALERERTIARTWLMRGTLHLVAADDLRWMLRLLGPVFATGNRARHAQLGLDEDLKARGVRAIRQILARSGPLTRVEIVEKLRRFGIRLDPRTQAPIHLIAFAALEGVCCLGPERGKGESTYVLLDDWIPAQRSRPAPPRQLAARYFSAFGPATINDFAAWSGLPMPAARTVVNDALPQLAETNVRGQAAFLPKGRLTAWRRGTNAPSVRLLPAFDTYLLGYRSRDLAVDRTLQRRLQRGGGWLHPAVVVDGRAVAAWNLKRASDRGRIVIEGFDPPTMTLRRRIEAETQDTGRFLNLSIELEVA